MATYHFVESHSDRIDHLIENRFIKTKSYFIEYHFIEMYPFLTNKKNEF
jgi:hypothetical protein